MLLAAAPLAAQRRVVTDATVGPSYGYIRGYLDDVHLAASATLAWRPVSSRATVLAFGAGYQGDVLTNADVLVACLDIVRPCPRSFPDHLGYGAILGGFTRGPARLLAGPAAYFGGVKGYGAQAQADLAGGFRHLALVLSARGALASRPNGDDLQLLTLSLGFRIR